MQDTDYKLIPLRALDGSIRAYTKVDEADFERYGHLRWHLIHNYVAHNLSVAKGQPKRSILLHREILGLTSGDGLEGDHIHGNTLDNRRSQLRIVTKSGNMQNRLKAKGSSGYRGVSWDKEASKWQASVKIEGCDRKIGRFAEKLKAARAAEAARRKHLPFAMPDTSLDPVPLCNCTICKPRPIPKHPGVYWHKARHKWLAKVGRTFYIGWFDDLTEAQRAVAACRLKHYGTCPDPSLGDIGPCVCKICRS